MSLSNPKTTFTIIPAETIVSNQPQRVLMVGQKTAAGSATSGSLVQDIQSNGSENDLFGEDSMLAEMVRAFKRVNKVSRLDAIPLSDDGAGVAALGSITFSGAPTEEGSLVVSIGSSINHTYTLNVTLVSTPTTLAADLVSKITADTKSLVSAIATLGVVDLTAVNRGTVGNAIGMSVDGVIDGLTVALNDMSGGATDPSLTNLFNVVIGLRYQTVVYPSQYTLSVLTTNFLNPRFNVDNAILDGVGIITKVDSVVNLKTLGNANNTQNLVIIGNKAINNSAFIAGAILEMDYAISSYFAAVRSLRFTQDVDISQYVIGSQSLDQFGGPALASSPYFNTPFYFLPIIPQGYQLTEEEVEDLGSTGVSVLGNNIPNNEIIAGALYTTYKTDAGGNPDPTYKFLNYVDTISNAREFMFNNAKSDFRQSRLTEGDLIPNRKIHNAASISAVITGYYNILSGPDYVLLQAGENALQFFKQSLTVTLDISQGKATITMKVPIVTQLRVIVATLQIAFSTNS